MMVSTGVNDAPVFATAYVGTAIGSGTDVAIEVADVTLMRDDPLDEVKAIRISDGTLQKNKQNLVWALGYNTATIPLALARTTPAGAGRRSDGVLVGIGTVEQSVVPAVHA